MKRGVMYLTSSRSLHHQEGSRPAHRDRKNFGRIGAKGNKANENSNLRLNLQWSVNVSATFQSLLRRTVAYTSPERDRSRLWPRHLNERLCHQDAAADVKTDSNPKAPCLDCMVDVASNHIPACRMSCWSLH
ncbi:hypothetical protein TNCV_2828641 [Trichonephila clavipes]|nr:hypothetical protein TNCV_2828641 [Trichonephila clavipes]